MEKCDSKPHRFQISNCKKKFQHQKYKPLSEALEKLKHDFAVAPIDEVANNVSFICKRFYATTLLRESGVTGTPNKTYKLISDYNKNTLINSTVNGIKQHISMSIQKIQRSFQQYIGYQKCINYQSVLDL